jgi:hypothetical protein
MVRAGSLAGRSSAERQRSAGSRHWLDESCVGLLSEVPMAGAGNAAATIGGGYAANRPGVAAGSPLGQVEGKRVERIEMATHTGPDATTRLHSPGPGSQPSGGQARSVKGLRPDPLRGLTDAPPPLPSRPGRGRGEVVQCASLG